MSHVLTPDTTSRETVEAPARKRGGGPRTPEGKERSRRNALKHGLTGAGVVLPEDIETDYQREAEACRRAWQPVDEVERRLVERAALADVRLRRCRKAEEAEIAGRVREAERIWEQKRAEEVLQHAGRLDTEPALAKLRLEATAEGCDWLIAQWDQLDAQLRKLGNWDRASTLRAVRLLGESGVPTVRTVTAGGTVVLNALALWANSLGEAIYDIGQDDLDHRDASPDPFASFFGGTFARTGAVLRWSLMRPLLPEAEPARAALSAQVAAERERLHERREWLHESSDDPDREDTSRRALVDGSVEGARRLRYESTAWSQWRQAIRDLEGRRRARHRDGEPLDAPPVADRWSWPDPMDLDPPAFDPTPVEPASDSPPPEEAPSAPLPTAPEAILVREPATFPPSTAPQNELDGPWQNELDTLRQNELGLWGSPLARPGSAPGSSSPPQMGALR